MSWCCDASPLWNGGVIVVENPVDKFWEFAGASPEEAKFFYTGGPLQVAEGTWFISLIGGVCRSLA